MQTISLMPPAAASMMASAANGAGTKMQLTSAPVPRLASATMSKMGTPRWVVPPFLFTGARHSDHQREFEVQITRSLDDSVGDFVAPRDAAKDVDQNPLHP